MKVAVLMGGTSSERNVSIASGKAISTALSNLNHEVVEIDTAGVVDLSTLGDGGIDVKPARPLPEDGRTVGAIWSDQVKGCDIAFLALHGGTGEDGTIQGLLELAGIPYTGSGVLASSLAMDKDIAKRLFIQAGVPSPKWVTFDDTERDDVGDMIDSLGGFPVVIKPVAEGSTVGLTVVQGPGGIERALELGFEVSRRLMAEEYIPGREITASILAGESLPLVEIRPKSGLYDYESKYQSGMSEYLVPAPLEPDVEDRIRLHALNAYNVLGCEGVARADFRLADDGRDYCLEINTCPGMTATSLVPMAAVICGLTFEDLVARILEHAFSRKTVHSTRE
jgi:D-alanine-D-alanine ligase